ncbi:MAG: 6,7-dimethyl-8-ribityllumazine synthase [Candidatus Sericytochromatia bacterium]|jgi:6,7-dimethyl-8-ribityllumazine synthase|nr:6,7-dimethyl-8-ribityllumazine synthase [Candidatus Sericytochromatia bacterium]
MIHIHGHLVVEPGTRFAVVIARFNELIGNRLLSGFEDAIVRHGGDSAAIDVYWVPGAFELPLLAQTVAESGRYSAVAALGAVIRGATPHFDYVAGEAAKGLQTASLKTGTPVVFGVLTTDTIEQAIERAGTKGGNKGWEAGMTAIEMANLMLVLKGPQSPRKRLKA